MLSGVQQIQPRKHQLNQWRKCPAFYSIYSFSTNPPLSLSHWKFSCSAERPCAAFHIHCNSVYQASSVHCRKPHSPYMYCRYQLFQWVKSHIEEDIRRKSVLSLHTNTAMLQGLPGSQPFRWVSLLQNGKRSCQQGMCCSQQPEKLWKCLSEEELSELLVSPISHNHRGIIGKRHSTQATSLWVLQGAGNMY